MIHVYLNYPNFGAHVHGDSDCAEIQRRNKRGQRVSRINLATISTELQKFANKNYAFASKPESNDLWLEIDLQDNDFELAVANYVLKSVARHYTPFRGVRLRPHCGDVGA